MGMSSMRHFSGLGSQLSYDPKKDFYQMLGVKVDEEPKKIKLAYYKLAQKYHPDKAGDDPQTVEKFKSISNAYEVLVDDTQRKKYDRLRAEAKSPKPSGYSNKKSQGGSYKAQGGRRDTQDDYFYGGFQEKDDFYDFYSKFTGSKQAGKKQDEQGRDRQYRQGSNDFYKTNANRGHSRYQQEQRRDQSATGQQYQRRESAFDGDDPFGGTKFNSRTWDQRGYRQSDHYEKWGKYSKSQDKDRASDGYHEWAKQQNGQGGEYDSKFNQFKESRHRTKTDAQRRAEREAKFGKYKPGEDSAFNEKNRAYQKAEVRNRWEAFMRGKDMFKINRDNQAQDFHGKDPLLNEEFDKAQSWFDGKTHESMARKPLQQEDVVKMVNPKIVIAVCVGISATKKAVDRLVS